MKVVVDRFEGQYAVCEKENREMIDFEKSKLPSGVSEGDVLIIEGDNIYIDLEETTRRKKKIEETMDDLWQ